MRSGIGSVSAWVVVTLLPPGTALAAPGISGEVSVGGRYDSNVAVLDLDRSSDEGDEALLLEAGIAYERALGERASARVGYDFSQSLHETFDTFDLQTHRGSLNASYDLGSVGTGAMLQYVNARLDGEEFLVFRQLSPYITRMFGERLYVRGAYEYTDKEFDGRPSRDAQSHAGDIKVFWFLDGVKRYWLFGYQYTDEDASAASLDYDGHETSVQYTQRFTAAARTVTVKLRAGYETRDYRGVSASIGEPRDEERLKLGSSLSWALSERWTTEASYEYAVFDSNLPVVDFSEHIVELTFGLTF